MINEENEEMEDIEEIEEPEEPSAADLVTVGAPPVCIAHRGASKEMPENTVAAFRRAIEQKADAIELDVRATKDGTLVCMHDKTLDRTTSGSGPVEEITFEELRKLDAGSWHSEETAGERVPTFAVGLETITGGAVCAAELKVLGTESRVLEIIQDCGVADSTMIVAFHEGTLANIRKMSPSLSLGWIVSQDPPEDHDAHAVELVQRALICGADVISASFTTITPELIQACQEEEIPLWVWTIDSEEPMGALLAAGINGITSNIPALLRRVIDEEGMEEEEEETAAGDGDPALQ